MTMKTIQPYLFCSILGLMAMLCVGCGDDRVQRFPVSGKITYAGKSIAVGDIHFDPDTTKGNHGPGGYAVIRDGRYETNPGRGVVGGAYIARISGFDGQEVKIDGEPSFKLGKAMFDECTLEVEFPHDAVSHDIEIPEQTKKKSR